MSELENRQCDEVIINNLTKERKEAYEKCYRTKQKLNHAISLVNSLKDRYAKEKKQYEEADRKLAMLDGRFKVVKIPKNTRISGIKLLMKLNKDQISNIAKQLGIEMEEQDEG